MIEFWKCLTPTVCKFVDACVCVCVRSCQTAISDHKPNICSHELNICWNLYTDSSQGTAMHQRRSFCLLVLVTLPVSPLCLCLCLSLSLCHCACISVSLSLSLTVLVSVSLSVSLSVLVSLSLCVFVVAVCSFITCSSVADVPHFWPCSEFFVFSSLLAITFVSA